LRVLAQKNASIWKLYATLKNRGKLRTVIDRPYPLAQIAEAHPCFKAGHKKGNVVVMVAGKPNEST
jgi:NADPH:quinone reductase-like Zn-dependent oxidoreductase